MKVSILKHLRNVLVRKLQRSNFLLMGKSYYTQESYTGIGFNNI